MDFRFFYGEDWSSRTYTDNKALISAVLSEMAYEHIEDAEQIDGDYAQAVQPHILEDIFAHREQQHWHENFLRPLELAEPDIIETDYAVSLVLNTPNVVFIATRGTRLFYQETVSEKDLSWIRRQLQKAKSIDLHDIPVDLNVQRQIHIENNTDYYFHKGFYTVARQILDHDSFPDLDDGKPVYFVGHSLGGAVSAIMGALYKNTGNSQSYVFGAPRYCSAKVFRDFCIPYAIVNPKDFITKAPRRFPCVPHEFTRTIEPATYGVHIPSIPFLAHHRMKTYLETIEKIVIKNNSR